MCAISSGHFLLSICFFYICILLPIHRMKKDFEIKLKGGSRPELHLLFRNPHRSMRIRILGVKPEQIHADPYPDPSHTVPPQKIGFDMKIMVLYEGVVMCHKTYQRTTYVKRPFRKAVNQISIFFTPGSRSAFPIRIPMQESKSINADHADPDPKHGLRQIFFPKNFSYTSV